MSGSDPYEVRNAALTRRFRCTIATSPRLVTAIEAA